MWLKTGVQEFGRPFARQHPCEDLKYSITGDMSVSTVAPADYLCLFVDIDRTGGRVIDSIVDVELEHVGVADPADVRLTCPVIRAAETGDTAHRSLDHGCRRQP